jgi:hypothetical protein
MKVTVDVWAFLLEHDLRVRGQFAQFVIHPGWSRLQQQIVRLMIDVPRSPEIGLKLLGRHHGKIRSMAQLVVKSGEDAAVAVRANDVLRAIVQGPASADGLLDDVLAPFAALRGFAAVETEMLRGGHI